MIKIERIMNMASKDNSLIEIAIDLLHKKQRPQNIYSIIKEVMSLKGIKAANVAEYAPQRQCRRNHRKIRRCALSAAYFPLW